MTSIRTIITGTGSYIPTLKVLNEDFSEAEFYGLDGKKIEDSTEETIKTFGKKTGVKFSCLPRRGWIIGGVSWLDHHLKFDPD